MIRSIIRQILNKYREFQKWRFSIVSPPQKIELDVKVPFWTKLKYNRLGFTDLEYKIFDLAHNDYRDFISKKERLRLEDVNGRFAPILGEKCLFERLFGHYVNVPHIHCWVKCGKFIHLDNNTQEVSLLNLIKCEERLIAKPTRSCGGGKKIHELSYVKGRYLIDGEEFEAAEFEGRCRQMEEYIFTKKTGSHAYSRAIYPDSANTMRIITVMDNQKNDVEILYALHRFGTKKSKFVDNISSGGVFAKIDIESGRMSKAKSLFNNLYIGEGVTKHPDTAAQIENVEIPQWKSICEKIKTVHKQFPFFKFFAWDVTLDERGEPWVLEINRGSDLNSQCLTGLRKSKLGKWMREQGMLDNF